MRETINAEIAEHAERLNLSYAVSGFSRTVVLACWLAVVAQLFAPVHAQAPTAVERVTFRQAIDRAIANNPSTTSPSPTSTRTMCWRGSRLYSFTILAAASHGLAEAFRVRRERWTTVLPALR